MALILDISQRQEQLLASLYTPGATVQSHESVETEFETLIQTSQRIVDLIERNCLLRDLSTGSLSELKKNGQILFDYIIPPKIKPQLKAAEIVDLTFQIDEQLVFIPWELLFDGQEFLCLRFNTGRCVRTSQSIEKSNRPLIRDPLQMLIIADPQGNLPAARREAVLIREQLAGSREIVITTKTKNVYGHYVQKNIREYDLLHYAGHADFDIQNPQNSGWRMSDGKLTCQDFLKLGASTPLPQLIFMNACQSVLSMHKPEANQFEQGLFGLANTFLMAGGRYVVGTLARVPDDSASEMASLFYHHFSAKESTGLALRMARQELARKLGDNDLAWAGYILYGEPAGTIFNLPNTDLTHVDRQAVVPKPRKLQRRKMMFFSILIILVMFWFSGPRLLALRQRQIGFHLYSSGQYEQAMIHYEGALRYFPDDGQAALVLSQIHSKLNQHPNAIQVLESILSRNPKQLLDGRVFALKSALAREYYALGRYSSAYKALTGIAFFDGQSPHQRIALYEYLGNAASLAQFYDQADEWFEKAAHLADEQSQFKTGIRLVLARADNIREAYLNDRLMGTKEAVSKLSLSQSQQLYEKAGEQAQKENNWGLSAEAHAGLGKIFQMQGDWGRAIRQYQSAVDYWEKLQGLTDVQTIQISSAYLDLAQLYIDPQLNFKEALVCLKKFDQWVRSIASSITTSSGQSSSGSTDIQNSSLIRNEYEKSMKILSRHFERLLFNLARKGYENSDLYHKAGHIYDRLQDLILLGRSMH